MASEETVMTMAYISVKPAGSAYKKLHQLLELHKKDLVDESDFEKLLDEVADSVFETTKAISGHCFDFNGVNR